MSNDRTFCCKHDCKNTECEVHQKHVKFPIKEISVADYSVTDVCELNKEGQDGKEFN